MTPDLKTGVENDIFWSETGPGFGDPGGTPPPGVPPGVGLPCPPPFIRYRDYWETVGPKQRSLSALTPGGTL